MAPGPTPVPPEVLAAGAAPIIHHRGPDFRELMLRTLGRLQQVCRTENDVLLFTASGSGAFESAIVNLLSPGERVLVVTAGAFGDRWCAMAAAFGADVHELRYAWGETPQPDDLRSRLDETGAEVVVVVHSETSTGVVADVQALARVAREAGAIVVVDAVSSLGAVPLETDAWGLDVVVAGSQKALMTPPGLSLATVSRGRVGAVEALDDAAVLLRLGAHARCARGRLDAVHARRHRSSPRSTSLSACCSRRGSMPHSHATPRSAAPAARARRRWGSSCSRPTRSDRPSSPRSSRRTASTRRSSCSSCATASGSRSPAPTASSGRACSGSVTSATTTCSTSRRH